MNEPTEEMKTLYAQYEEQCGLLKNRIRHIGEEERRTPRYRLLTEALADLRYAMQLMEPYI